MSKMNTNLNYNKNALGRETGFIELDGRETGFIELDGRETGFLGRETGFVKREISQVIDN